MSGATESGKVTGLNIEHAVGQRYSAASQASEPALCCPVQYDTSLLKVLPQELIDRDYGCGDPSRYVREGEVVLDLGSGGGKICYIASQVVGEKGRVIGIDMNNDMLALAHRYQQEIGDRIGWHNVTFHKGRIQDLALDLDKFESYLVSQPVTSTDDWIVAQDHAQHLRSEQPMVPPDSVDVVLSNCVLNLVSPGDRQQLFAEVFRVLQRGGRAVISDIVCDEPVPERLQNDPTLWSGCISGAHQESEFLTQFEQAGFYGIEVVERQDQPWATVEGIEFRSMTVRAFKGKEGPSADHKQAVIYRGPWKSVTDDDGHVIRRGVRTAVCQKRFDIYASAPYADHVCAVTPHTQVDVETAPPFDGRQDPIRDSRETKGAAFTKTELPAADCCGPDNCC
jgi:SAM-dependent methyltransferase